MIAKNVRLGVYRVALIGTLTVLTPDAGSAQAAPTSRQAQAELDAGICAQRTGNAALDIITCTRAINFGEHSALTLATLHNSRGHAYRLTGRGAKALAEHSAAITANPASAEGFVGRALVLIDADELAAARTDLDQAVSLFPRFGFAWKHRGRIDFLQGDDAQARINLDRAIALNDADGEAFTFRGLVAFREGHFEKAIADFEAGEARRLGYMYIPLWIHLASTRLGRHDVAVLDAGLESLRNDEQWPGVLIRSYRNEASPRRVLEQARQAPGGLAIRREAEAAFYLGQLALGRGDSASASRYFATVHEKAPPDSVERAMLP